MDFVVKGNIVNNLFVIIVCPICNERIEVSLGMLHRKETGICPHCITPMVLYMEEDWLDSFVSGFDNLFKHVQEFGLPLKFSDKPVATPLELD
jgi:hypothetical protein